MGNILPSFIIVFLGAFDCRKYHTYLENYFGRGGNEETLDG